MPVTGTFRPGDSVQWTTREGGTLTNRSVKIERLDGDHAVVTFGLRSDGTGEPRRFNAPLDELSPPPRPAGPPPFLPGWAETPRPPDPPSANALNAKLAERRAALRAAHQRAKQAREAVDAARDVADRARRELDAARAALAAMNLADAEAAADYEAAIRRGEAPTYRNGHDRDGTRHRVEVAQLAADKFDAELREAQTMFGERLDEVRRAAASVVAAILNREAEQLRQLEQQAAKFRGELLAASQWWPDASLGPLKLGPAAATVLSNPAPQPRASAGIGDWKGLFDRLVRGETDADFELET